MITYDFMKYFEGNKSLKFHLGYYNGQPSDFNILIDAFTSPAPQTYSLPGLINRSARQVTYKLDKELEFFNNNGLDLTFNIIAVTDNADAIIAIMKNSEDIIVPPFTTFYVAPGPITISFK